MGRFSRNFTDAKEAYVNEHEPGGGGWSLQQLTLATLYSENEGIMNWWTRSNKGLPLCRFLGMKFTLYRQQQTDYIFAYEIEQPFNIGKYYYPSLHPIRMLNYNKKVIIPSLATQPHRRKPYKTLKIKPTKELLNKWYFQQFFAKQPLIQFSTIACSLNSMFQATNALNNNITLYYINVGFFQNPQFNFPDTKQWGYQPKTGVFLYGIPQPSEPSIIDTPVKNIVYLGNTKLNDQGDEIGEYTESQYKQNHWGNPFYFRYLNGDYPTFITDKDPKFFIDKINTTSNITLKQLTQTPTQITITWKLEPFILSTRYNPNYDKGKGNRAYWIRNDDFSQTNYEPTSDPDLEISNFPFWLMLFGWVDYTLKINKAKNLSQDWMLVLRTNYLRHKSTAYPIISDTYLRGQGPFNVDYQDLTPQQIAHWYPRFNHQQEAIESILETGPGFVKSEHQKSIQAHLKYTFYFKWGGNPAAMENVYDPLSQPTYPQPYNEYIQHENTNPETPIGSFIYAWDQRRDILTQNAAKRITDFTLYDPNVFTDGTETTENIQKLLQKTTQEEETSEEEVKALFQLFQQLQQQNSNLQFRLRQLTTMAQSL